MCKEMHLYLFKIRLLGQKFVEMNQNPIYEEQKTSKNCNIFEIL